MNVLCDVLCYDLLTLFSMTLILNLEHMCLDFLRSKIVRKTPTTSSLGLSAHVRLRPEPRRGR